MKNITYLIGAGASYQSLPLIKTMSKRMKAFSDYLKQKKEKGKLENESAKLFIEELDILLENEKESTSIDAYAKELTNSNKTMELHRLKIILSSYIIFEQLIKPKDLIFYEEDSSTKLSDELQEMLLNPLDKRYRTFWSNYINGPNSKPSSNIKVISWNYDMQFEFSFSKLKGYSLEMTQQELQVFPSENNDFDKSKFGILKINGTAGIYKDKTVTSFKNLFDLKEHKLDDYNINILLEYFKANYRRVYSEPIFSFAWEKTSIVENTRTIAKEIIKNTEILVIIGYSLPSFNREIDRELFSDISNLEKIYYQAPENEINSLKMKLDGINPNLSKMTVGINDLDSFHIPNEY